MDWPSPLAWVLQLVSARISFGVTSDMTKAFMKALKDMQAKEVLAGFPESTSERKDENGEESPITNAAIAYVQNTGMPELNIPQREFMESGTESKREDITDGMREAGLAALDGDRQRVEAELHRVGLAAQNGIQSKINEGPFVPLADSTVEARARRGRHGAQEEMDRRAAGEAPGTDLARPLVDTAQLEHAVTYLVREK